MRLLAAMDESLSGFTGNSNEPRVLTHTIVKGDTLWDIARKYGTDVDTIVAANKLTRENQISVGQTLKILTVPGVLHKVAGGETVWTIALKYKVDKDKILAANRLDPENPALTAGQELIVPGAKPPRPATYLASRGGTSSRGTSSAKSISGFMWPFRGRITSGFGMRWGRMHTGLDIAGAYGSPIVAAKAGTVIFNGWKGGYGYTVMIDHGGGVTTLYGHNSKNLVQVGEHVDQGQTIALIGSSGQSTGPHVHFEIRVNGWPQDPRPSLP